MHCVHLSGVTFVTKWLTAFDVQNPGKIWWNVFLCLYNFFFQFYVWFLSLNVNVTVVRSIFLFNFILIWCHDISFSVWDIVYEVAELNTKVYLVRVGNLKECIIPSIYETGPLCHGELMNWFEKKNVNEYVILYYKNYALLIRNTECY